MRTMISILKREKRVILFADIYSTENSPEDLEMSLPHLRVNKPSFHIEMHVKALAVQQCVSKFGCVLFKIFHTHTDTSECVVWKSCML